MANTFEYQPYRSPFAGSIAELMAHQHDPQARAAEQIGQAQARAAEISGNAWGQAAQGIGQQVAGAVQQATDPRRKMEQIQASELQKRVAETDTIQGLMKATPLVDLGNGVKGYDLPALTAAITAKGGDPAALVQHVTPVNDALVQFHAGRLAVVQAGAKALQAAGNDPTLADNFLTLLETNGIAKSDQVKEFRALATTPEGVAKLTALYAGPQQFEVGPAGGGVVNKGTGQVVGKIPDKPPAPSAAGFAKDAAGGDPAKALELMQAPEMAARATSAATQAETARHNSEMEKIGRMTAGREVAAQQETARHNRATEAQAASAAGDKTDLTPEGLDAAAMMFAKTGQLPALGMGDKTTRKAIINRAAVMVPGLDVASAKADYGANQNSLKNITGTLDTLSAFEKTSGKNLDQFLALADKIPDTGVPWLNVPVRMLNDKMVGSENQAAAQAARDVALREIARVTNDPKLSGVLSDAARKEVSSLSPTEATFGQIKAVAKVLKQDMANVHQSMTEQQAAIQNRIKLGGPASTPPPQTGMIEAKDAQGNIHHAPAGTPLPAGWTLVTP